MPTPDAALDKAGVWRGPVSADSPLLTPATLAKLQPSEAALVPALAHVLLLQHGPRLEGGAAGAVHKLLALCLLHHGAEVRRAAVAACHAMTAQQPALMAALLAALRAWANSPAEALVLAVSRARRCAAQQRVRAGMQGLPV